MKSRVKALIALVLCIPMLYTLSSGPAVKWVRQPIIKDRSLSAFDHYDRRLDAYLSFYSPLLKLRSRLKPVDFVLGAYERFFQRSLSHDPGSVLCQLHFCRRTYQGLSWGGHPPPGAASDARERLRSGGIPFATGYAFYLPRSEILVAEGTPDDINLFECVVSDGPDLSHFAATFH